MMHEPEKSDSAVVAVKPANKAERSGGGAGGAKGRDQGERGPAKHAPGAGPGKCVTGAGARTASREAKEEGKVHLASPPCQIPMLRTAFYALKRDAAPGVDGMTWQAYEAGPRSPYRGPARKGPTGSVPGATVSPEVHTEGGRSPTPARGRSTRRQDRPKGRGHGAERDLRGGFPRVLVWVPTRTQPA